MNYFEKKQWIRLAVCAVVLLAVALVLTGVIGGKNLTYKLPEDTEETKAIEAPQGDNVKTVTVKGFQDGDVIVYVTVGEGNTVEALTVDANSQTPNVGQKAMEDSFTSQFIGKTGPFVFGENGVDSITGATVTSNAVLGAVNEALGTQPSEENSEKSDEPAPETTENPDSAGTKDIAEAAGGNYQYQSEQGTTFSIIRVYANTEDGKITECKIESEGVGKPENDLLTDEIRDAWAKSIVENGTANNDVITGATIKASSEAVINAVNEILEQIGTENQTEIPPVETSVPTTEETKPEETSPETTTEPASETTEKQEETAPFTGKAVTEVNVDSSRVVHGSYMAKRETDYSIIRVYIDASGSKITKCRIESEAKEGKQDFMTDEIKTEWAKQIEEKGQIDAVTGATRSSEAVADAVSEILGQVKTDAGEDAPEGQPEPEPAMSGVIWEVTVTNVANDGNTEVVDYLIQDPYLANIYEGYGFAKDYGSARGHAYTLEDVAKTQRPHPKANCITCKTDDFARMVNQEGVGVYSRTFEEVYPAMQETISCYTCHGDSMGADGKLAVTHSYVNTALGDAVNEIAPAILSCGQCHIEYYFTPSDSETMMPYHNVAEMTPDTILAYYDGMEMPDGSTGFSDWTQPTTGAKMLKAQHPEMETVLGGIHAKQFGMTCASCHMPAATTAEGQTFKSHTFTSPLKDESLLQSCATCHKDTNMVVKVQTIQQNVTARETEVGNKLSGLKDALAAAVTEGKKSEENLNAVRKLYREAQWFFDFCYVENSEGAHNSTLSLYCLETSESRIDEAMALLGAAN